MNTDYLTATVLVLGIVLGATEVAKKLSLTEDEYLESVLAEEGVTPDSKVEPSGDDRAQNTGEDINPAGEDPGIHPFGSELQDMAATSPPPQLPPEPKTSELPNGPVVPSIPQDVQEPSATKETLDPTLVENPIEDPEMDGEPEPGGEVDSGSIEPFIELPSIVLKEAEPQPDAPQFHTVNLGGVDHTVIDGQLFHVIDDRTLPVAAGEDTVFGLFDDKIVFVNSTGAGIYTPGQPLVASKTPNEPVTPLVSDPDPALNRMADPQPSLPIVDVQLGEEVDPLGLWNEALEEIHKQSVELSQLNEVMVKLQQNVQLVQQLRPHAGLAKDLLSGASLLDVLDGWAAEDRRARSAQQAQQRAASAPAAPNVPAMTYDAASVTMVSDQGIVLRNPLTNQTTSLDVGEVKRISRDAVQLRGVRKLNDTWSVELMVNGTPVSIAK